MNNDYISFFDLAILPFYLVIVYFVAFAVKSRAIVKNPDYKYFMWGLHAKVVGAIAICFIYVFYYKGGDTINYFEGSRCMVNLAFHNWRAFVDVMSGNLDFANYHTYFNYEIGYPPTYMYKDPNTYAVVRIVTPLTFICFKSYLATSVMLAVLSYTGIWRLYLLFTREYPGISSRLAIAVLFVPSVVFWGSGILKDTVAFSAACWFTYSFYMVFIKGEKRVVNVLFLIIAINLILAVKPYIFVALLPGSILWMILDRLKRIKAAWLRLILAPAIVIGGIILGLFVLSRLSDQLGDYQLDKIVNKAKVTQDDLKRETYGENSFDIGEFDGSLASLAWKAPIAVTAALFRPFLWEANNPVMLISAIENTIIMFMFFMLFVRIRLSIIYKVMVTQPIIMFSLLFTVMFSFSLGLSTSNFGAMVLYKIPMMPFFVGAVLIIRHYGVVLLSKNE